MPHRDRCSNRMEMAFLRETPLSEALFLSIVAVGEPSQPRAQHPVGLWFSGLATCGSNYFMGEKSKFFKGQSQRQLEEEREASYVPGT